MKNYSIINSHLILIILFNIDIIISDYITKRPVSIFTMDIEANKETLS